MKRKTLGTVAIIVLVAVLLFGISFFARGAGMGFPDKRLCFDMSVSRFKLIKGEPYEQIKYNETREVTLYYTEDVYGYPASASYSFFMTGLFGNRLSRADISVNNLEYSSAKELFYAIVEDQKEAFKNEEGFYFEDNSDESAHRLSASLGTDDGATGVRFTIEYINSTKSVYFNTFNLK